MGKDSTSIVHDKPVVSIPSKIVRLIVDEACALLSFVITKWPNSPLGTRARRLYWKNKTSAKNIIVGRGTEIGDCRFFVFGENLDIGDNVEFVADGVDGYKVFLGSNISFARGVYLRSANHRWDDPDRLIMGQGHRSKSVSYMGANYSVVIEDDCWIGANVIILSGAMIGKGSVVGAGSVVTGAIPPYSIAAGSPARVISVRSNAATPHKLNDND